MLKFNLIYNYKKKWLGPCNSSWGQGLHNYGGGENHKRSVWHWQLCCRNYSNHVLIQFCFFFLFLIIWYGYWLDCSRREVVIKFASGSGEGRPTHKFDSRKTNRYVNRTTRIDERETAKEWVDSFPPTPPHLTNMCNFWVGYSCGWNWAGGLLHMWQSRFFFF
jgi:hypothetical protein